MVFLEFVFYRVWSGVAAEPELFNKLLALFVGPKAVICSALFIGNNVGNVLVEPFLKDPARIFLFARPFRGICLFRVISLCIIPFLGRGPGRSQKKQESEGDNNPSSAHTTPRVRLVSIYKY